MLLTLVIVYLLITIAIGLWAAKRVKNTADFAIAGRHLPLVMIVTTTFATWFGSETVLGIPAKFVQGGLNGVVEDPFGAGTCLILVGLFFATKLYKQNLLTIGDFYRQRYGRGIDKETCRRFVLMYVNDYTKRLGPDGEAALRRLYDLAHAKGLIREKPPVDPI